MGGGEGGSAGSWWGVTPAKHSGQRTRGVPKPAASADPLPAPLILSIAPLGQEPTQPVPGPEPTTSAPGGLASADSHSAVRTPPPRSVNGGQGEGLAEAQTRSAERSGWKQHRGEPHTSLNRLAHENPPLTWKKNELEGLGYVKLHHSVLLFDTPQKSIK